MGRVFSIIGTFVFSIGLFASLTLIIMLTIDREYDDLPRVAFGAVALAGAAWSSRRSWQRANQEREFRREYEAECAAREAQRE